MSDSDQNRTSSEQTYFDGCVPPPRFVSIETTRYCNLTCSMCLSYQGGTTVYGPHMDRELFDVAAHELFPHVMQFQPSVSGEPLMTKGLDHQLEIASRYGVRTEICTNGTLLDARMRSRVLPSLGKMIISFDGATKETFEWIRGSADFDTVVENVRALADEVAKVPQERRPVLSFGTVLMRKNIEELAPLVALAKELGIHYIGAAHLHPATEDMKRQSLVHSIDLAKAQIDRACEAAEQLEMPLIIQGLGQLNAASALSAGSGRALAIQDGIVQGLEARSVLADRIPSFPAMQLEGEVGLRARELRAAARKESPYPKREEPSTDVSGTDTQAQSGPIQVCDYAWNKTYIAIDGNVNPCCVPGMPNLGSLSKESFPEIWNGPAFRRLRESLVLCDPIQLCKGCPHIEELHDPSQIAAWIGSARIPLHAPTDSLPEQLDPLRIRSADEAPAPGSVSPLNRADCPILRWDERPGALGYHIEFSLDESFAKIVHTAGTTSSALLQNTEYQIPLEKWIEAPLDKKVFWRVFANHTSRDKDSGSGIIEVGSGSLQRS